MINNYNIIIISLYDFSFYRLLQQIVRMIKMKRIGKEVDNAIQMAIESTHTDPSGSMFGRRSMILKTLENSRARTSNQTATLTTRSRMQEHIYKEQMRLNYTRQELIRKRKLYNIND